MHPDFMPAESRLLCPGCGRPISATASENLCTACLLTGALEWGNLPEETLDQDPIDFCGPYELLDEIGRGGMGVVFRARERGLPRVVALKMISHAHFASPDEVRRFKLEAEVIAQLDHPHIVTLFAVGEHDGRPFFVMKLAEGGTLAERTSSSHPKEAVKLMCHVARAVHHAHGHGVLHRDLKPANILLETDGTPLVSDFGLARLAHGPAGMTLTGTALGTPAYMSPEQARGVDAVTTSADVYGLGAILYFLLTAQAPFVGESPMATLQLVLHKEPVSPRKISPLVDHDLATICLKCLEKNPAQRYRSAAALADDLERWERGESVVARPAPKLEQAWKWSRRHPAKATLLAALALGFCVLGTVLTLGNRLLRKERNFAQAQELVAHQEASRAAAAAEAMRENVYAADVFLASRALEDGHLGATRATLLRHVPQAGETDLRGYEWHALERLCRGDDLKILARHQGAVQALASSPDGSLLAMGGREGVVQIWNLKDGLLSHRLPDVNKPSTVADFMELANLPMKCPETERLIASGTTLDSVRMWARASRLGDIRCLAWSPDGTRLLTGGNGGYVRIWRTKDWRLEGFIPMKQVSQGAFSEDSRQIILAVDAQPATQILIYDLATLERRETLQTSLPRFGLAGKQHRLAYGVDGSIIVRDLLQELEIRWRPDHSIMGLSLSPDGERIVVLSTTGGTLRNTMTGVVIAGLQCGQAPLQTAAFSPDGRQFAVAGSDQKIYAFDGITGAPQHSLRGHDAGVWELEFSIDGKHLYSGSNDQTARIWSARNEVQDSAEIAEVNSPLNYISNSGNLALSTNKDGSVMVYDWAKKQMTRTPLGAHRKACGFAQNINNESAEFLTVRQDSRTFEWWHTDGSAAAPPLKLDVPADLPVTVCPGGNLIAVGSSKVGVKLFDWSTGNVLKSFSPTPLNALRLIGSHDGRFICACDYPRRAALLDTHSGTWLWNENLTQGTLGPVVFSPDGQFLVSSGDDAILSVRSVSTGKIITTLRGHFSEVKALAFSQDGRTLASSSHDKTLRLWHVPTWRELGVLRRDLQATSLHFAPQGLFVEEYQQRWMLLRGK